MKLFISTLSLLVAIGNVSFAQTIIAPINKDLSSDSFLLKDSLEKAFGNGEITQLSAEGAPLLVTQRRLAFSTSDGAFSLVCIETMKMMMSVGLECSVSIQPQLSQDGVTKIKIGSYLPVVAVQFMSDEDDRIVKKMTSLENLSSVLRSLKSTVLTATDGKKIAYRLWSLEHSSATLGSPGATQFVIVP
jgi:hypothetical protein